MTLIEKIENLQSLDGVHPAVVAVLKEMAARIESVEREVEESVSFVTSDTIDDGPTRKLEGTPRAEKTD